MRRWSIMSQMFACVQKLLHVPRAHWLPSLYVSVCLEVTKAIPSCPSTLPTGGAPAGLFLLFFHNGHFVSNRGSLASEAVTEHRPTGRKTVQIAGTPLAVCRVVVWRRLELVSGPFSNVRGPLIRRTLTICWCPSAPPYSVATNPRNTPSAYSCRCSST